MRDSPAQRLPLCRFLPSSDLSGLPPGPVRQCYQLSEGIYARLFGVRHCSSIIRRFTSTADACRLSDLQRLTHTSVVVRFLLSRFFHVSCFGCPRNTVRRGVRCTVGVSATAGTDIASLLPTLSLCKLQPSSFGLISSTSEGSGKTWFTMHFLVGFFCLIFHTPMLSTLFRISDVLLSKSLRLWSPPPSTLPP